MLCCLFRVAVVADRREAVAAAELIDAEKAAKFAAEAEAKAVAQELQATQRLLDSEREVAKKVCVG